MTAGQRQKRLWLVDDGERYWIMAPTAEEALVYYRQNCADGQEEDARPTIVEVTDKAREIPIRDDEEMGPRRSARHWMDEETASVVLIGTTAC